jgi:ABC-type antimicrobial peptide transport system permease subunit
MKRNEKRVLGTANVWSNCVQFADIDSFSTLGRLPENRLRAILLAFFSLTAVSLACVGLYGTLSYAMNGRRREVGLRQALGVLRTQVVRQFLVQGLRVSLLGSLGGPALAIAFARLRSGMLYGVSVSRTR